MILDAYLDSGLNKIEYLDSISVNKSGVRAQWSQIGYVWRTKEEVMGYEFEYNKLVSVRFREVLLNLFSMVKMVKGEIKVDKFEFMKYHETFEEMMSTSKTFAGKEDCGWKEEKEVIVYGDQPSKDFMLKGKKVHTTCKNLAERFNCGKTQIQSLKYYTTESQTYFALYIQKNNLDEPYEVCQGLPKGFPTVIFVAKDTAYLQHQLHYFKENNQKIYLVKMGGYYIE